MNAVPPYRELGRANLHKELRIKIQKRECQQGLVWAHPHKSAGTRLLLQTEACLAQSPCRSGRDSDQSPLWPTA